MEEIQKEIRRKDVKRKEGESIKPKPKRKKLGKLTNWGELCILDDIQEETAIVEVMRSSTNFMVQDVRIVKDRVVLETENIDMNVKVRKKKAEISKEVQKKKFIFNTRGKLTKAEQKEIIRTHRGGVFDWFRKPERICELESAETIRDQEEVIAEVQVDGAMGEVIREERLSRMERRKKEQGVGK